MTGIEKERLVKSIAAVSAVYLAYQWMGTAGVVLSVSILFVWSRWANYIQKCPENTWDPNYSKD